MPIISASFSRDANGVPITFNGITLPSNPQTLTGTSANSPIITPIFGITGTVLVTGIYGVVTTVLGANHTTAYWRLNDQTAQVSITASSGTTLSTLGVGTTIVKKGLAAAALTALDSAAGRISEPTTLETLYFSPFVAMQKTGGVATNIEYVYSTTDTPTSGAITFYITFVPVSPNGTITAL